MSLPVPTELPIMTLPNVVLFPHSMLPLHIYEPRYKQMLNDVLNGNRLFGVATLKDTTSEVKVEAEVPYPTASIGIIRASQKNDDESSNLIIQGISRITIENIVEEEPYRIAKVIMLEATPGADDKTLSLQRDQLIELVRIRQKIHQALPVQVIQLLDSIPDPEICANIASFAICPDTLQKQKLLEAFETYHQLDQLIQYLTEDNRKLKLEGKLLNDLDVDDIGLN